MANPTHLQSFGNQIAVLFDDGTKKLAYPTTGDLWIISGAGGGPGPGPGSGDFILPFPYSSVWAYNEFHSPERPNHEGIDFGPGLGVNGGEDIIAAADGRVEFAGWGGDWFGSSGFGNLVVIDHGTVNGDSLWTLYAHMRALPLVTTNQTITQSTVLGYVGDTGNAFGEHLHWETWINEVAVNPRDFMTTYGA